MMRKLLVATEKPFAKTTVEIMRNIATVAGFDFRLSENHKNVEELISETKDAEALIVRSDKISEQIIDNSPDLKIIVRAGAGYDNIDLDACTNRNITVMNTPGQNSNAVAELVIGLMIYMSRNCFRQGTGRELRGKKLGVHGCGNVGRLVVAAGRALGMETFAYDPILSSADKQNIPVIFVDSASELYSKCDYVSLHIPANNETVKSVDFSLLSKLPHNAVVINTARKEIINEDDLLKVMKSDKQIRYATDVLPDNHKELEAFGTRYFSILRKIGAETFEANSNAGIAAVNQIIDFFETGNIKYKVNK